jgi:hypothetical protein
MVKVSSRHSRSFGDQSVLFRLDFIFCYMFQSTWDHHEAVIYCGVAPRGRSIERPLLINGYDYLAVSLPDNGPVDSNS